MCLATDTIEQGLAHLVHASQGYFRKLDKVDATLR